MAEENNERQPWLGLEFGYEPDPRFHLFRPTEFVLKPFPEASPDLAGMRLVIDEDVPDNEWRIGRDIHLNQRSANKLIDALRRSDPNLEAERSISALADGRSSAAAAAVQQHRNSTERN